MKQPDFAKWYFYQLLKDYEGEQLYLNEGNAANLLI